MVKNNAKLLSDLRKSFLILISLFFLVGCKENNPDNSDQPVVLPGVPESVTTLTGTISNGRMLKSVPISVKNSSGELLKSVQSNETGNFTFELSSKVKFPVFVSAVDVAQSDDQSDDTLVAAISGNGSDHVSKRTIHVNPITTFIARKSYGDQLNENLTLTNELFSQQANQAIASALGGGLTYTQFSTSSEFKAHVENDPEPSPSVTASLVNALLEQGAEQGVGLEAILKKPETFGKSPLLEQESVLVDFIANLIITNDGTNIDEQLLEQIIQDGYVLNSGKQVLNRFQKFLSINSDKLNDSDKRELALKGVVAGINATLKAELEKADIEKLSELNETGFAYLISNVIALVEPSVIATIEKNGTADKEDLKGLLKFLGVQGADLIRELNLDILSSDFSGSSSTQSNAGILRSFFNVVGLNNNRVPTADTPTIDLAALRETISQDLATLEEAVTAEETEPPSGLYYPSEYAPATTSTQSSSNHLRKVSYNRTNDLEESTLVFIQGKTIKSCPQYSGGYVTKWVWSNYIEKFAGWPFYLETDERGCITARRPDLKTKNPIPIVVEGRSWGGRSRVVKARVYIEIRSEPISDFKYKESSYTINSNEEFSIYPTCEGSCVFYDISPRLPKGLEIHPKHGRIYGTPLKPLEKTKFTVNVKDGDNKLHPFDLTLEINSNAPSNLKANPTESVITVGDIAPIYLSAEGSGLTYSIEPLLPMGMTLVKNRGIIGGAPWGGGYGAGWVSVGNKKKYTVTATNGEGSISTDIWITLRRDPPTELSYQRDSTVYTLGKKIPENHVAFVKGDGVIYYSVSPDLPEGLEIHKRKGYIYGKPTTITPATKYTVKASNNSGYTTADLTIAVNQDPPSDLRYTFENATYSQSYAIRIPVNSVAHVKGSDLTYTADPDLPDGLYLQKSSGAISGRPKNVQSAQSYKITATNDYGSTTADISITITDGAPSGLVYTHQNVTYTVRDSIVPNQVKEVNGSPLRYSVSPDLPKGLKINKKTGAIHGTPEVTSDPATYTITAKHYQYGSTTANVTIAIQKAIPTGLTISESNLLWITGKEIDPVTATVETGAPIRYTITPELPKGLALHSTSGVIHGIPEATHETTIHTIRASNYEGSIEKNITVTVNLGPPTGFRYERSSISALDGFVINANDVANIVHGGEVSYSVSPSLPQGLKLYTDSGRIFGTPVGVHEKKVYTVTATNAAGSMSTDVDIEVKPAQPSRLEYEQTQTLYRTHSDPIKPNTVTSIRGSKPITYSIDPALPAGLNIDTATGTITGAPTEVRKATSYTVTATNSAGSTTATVRIEVRLRAPGSLQYDLITAYYTAGSVITPNKVKSVVGRIDKYWVTPDLPEGLILDEATGTISGTPKAESEMTAYRVYAENQSGRTIKSLAIQVHPAPPAGLKYTVSPAVYSVGVAIPENRVVSSPGSKVTYYVSPALPEGLILNTETGSITGTPTTEQVAKIYRITATNISGSTTTGLSITVNHVAPVAFAYGYGSAVYTVGQKISENRIVSQPGQGLRYSITPALPKGLSLNSADGSISGTPTEEKGQTSYRITATNSGGSGSVNVTIAVNYPAPTGLSYQNSASTYTIGQQIAANNATITGEGLSWSVDPALPNGLVLNATTGVISGTPTSEQTEKNYQITARNSGGAVNTTIAITINHVAPNSWNYKNPSVTYIEKETITENSITTAPGLGLTYSVTPDLPVGLALDTTTGTISGTPINIQDSREYTVTATNSGGSSTTKVAIKIDYAIPTGLTYEVTAASYTEGSAITVNRASVKTGSGITYSVTPSLPDGLLLDSGTGIISGIPKLASSEATYVVKASNPAGSVTVDLKITVGYRQPADLVYKLFSASYTAGGAITPNQVDSVIGTITNYSISPELPPGLTIDTTTGTISGTPDVEYAQDSTDYTVTATNPVGFTTAKISITIDMSPPSGLTYGNQNAVYTMGQAITANKVVAVNGSGITYSISPALPGSLSLDSKSGAISGTPDAIQDATKYTITATNYGGSTTTEIMITVNYPAPTGLTYSTASSVYTVGVAISENRVSGITGEEVSYSVSPDLPEGLALNAATGAITGTPTTEQSAGTYKVKATNSGGSTTTNLTITINYPVPTGLSYTMTDAVYTVDTTIVENSVKSVSGQGIAYSIDPALPNGLTIDSATGKISGTATVETAKTNYTVSASNSGGKATTVISITVNYPIPSGLSYKNSETVYTVGEAITENSVTATPGRGITYSVNPSLPTGLTLDSTSGTISGKPMVEVGKKSYTVTASNSGGTTTVELAITVNYPAPTGLSYKHSTAIYAVGDAITPNTATITGEGISWAVIPALPAGLALDASTGVISGTPAVASKTTSYKVIASNSGGSTDTTITITTLFMAPKVTSVLPVDQAVEIAVDSQVTATFDKDLDPSTVTNTNVIVKQGSTVVAGEVTYSDKQIGFRPTGTFNTGTLYNVTLTTGIKDSLGTALEANYSWSFTTFVPLAVTSITPDASGDAKMNTKIMVTFNKTLNADTINNSSFLLKRYKTDTSGKIVVEDKTVIFTPDRELYLGYWYNVTLTTDIADASGNTLEQQFYSTFKTIPYFTTMAGTSSNEYDYDVEVDRSGNTYVLGATSGEMETGVQHGKQDIFLVKYDATGDQQWARQIGGDDYEQGGTMALDSNGNIFIAAQTKSSNFDGHTNLGYGDILITKYNATGNKLWSQLFGTTAVDDVKDIVTDTLGNVFMVGHTGGTFEGNTGMKSNDIFIAKYNASGEKQWIRQLGTDKVDYGFGIAISEANNLYITGFTSGSLSGHTNAGRDDLYLIKYDSEGNEVWTQMYGGVNYDKPYEIALDAQENVYISGITNSALEGDLSFGNYDHMLVKFDASGARQWTQQFGTDQMEYSGGMVLGADGSVYIGGYTKGKFDGGSASSYTDIYLAKYNASGERLWLVTNGGSKDDSLVKITKDSAGNLYLVGRTNNTSLDGVRNKGYNDVFLMKYNSDGIKQ